jgi:hypothetical protein
MKKASLYVALASLTLGAAALPVAAFANDPDKHNDSAKHEAGATSRWNGTVEAVSSESLTLKETDGKSVKVELGKQTKFDNSGKSGSVSDLRAGMNVAIQGEKQKNGTVRATEISYVKAS